MGAALPTALRPVEGKQDEYVFNEDGLQQVVFRYESTSNWWVWRLSEDQPWAAIGPDCPFPQRRAFLPIWSSLNSTATAPPAAHANEPAPPSAFPGIAELEELCVYGDYFIRRASPGITPIWYRYIPGRGWFWSPYFPPPDWIPVARETVPDGPWQGHSPAQVNLAIIRYLRKHEPEPEGTTVKN